MTTFSSSFISNQSITNTIVLQSIQLTVSLLIKSVSPLFNLFQSQLSKSLQTSMLSRGNRKRWGRQVFLYSTFLKRQSFFSCFLKAHYEAKVLVRVSSCCCWCTVPIPTAGAGKGGRLTRRSLQASCFSNLGETKNHGPMF